MFEELKAKRSVMIHRVKATHPNKLLMENLLASILRIHSFSAHYAVLWTENNMKSISTIKPTITENTECTVLNVHAPVIDIKVGARQEIIMVISKKKQTNKCKEKLAILQLIGIIVIKVRKQGWSPTPADILVDI